jgi:hypothetical protein
MDLIRRVLGRLAVRRTSLVVVLSAALVAVVAIAFALPSSRERLTSALGESGSSPSGETTEESTTSAEPSPGQDRPPPDETAPGVLPSPEPTKVPGPTSTPIPPGPQDTPGDGSGVYGTASAGPTCPVERADSPCPDRPVDDGLVRATTSDGHTAGETRTDGDGRFRMSLDPGTYDITVETQEAMSCETARVAVEADRFTRVTISCDTGIR